MKRYHFSDMKGGWFVGAFTPTAFSTSACEVSFKFHPKDEQWPYHYHTKVTEINLITKGVMELQGQLMSEGDIFVLEPYEVADPLFVTDCQIVCVKLPGNAGNDKIVFKTQPSS